jgi:hypothetical protein
MIGSGHELVVALLACGGVACAGKMTRITRAIDRYEALLRVEVAVELSPEIGEELELAVTLANASPSESVDACLGSLKSHMWLAVPLSAREGKPPVAAQTGTIDHSYCATRFHLAPGAWTAWSEPLMVPDIGPGPADLTVGVDIVHPKDCDRYGCYDAWSKASPVRFQLRRRAGAHQEGSGLKRD